MTEPLLTLTLDGATIAGGVPMTGGVENAMLLTTLGASEDWWGDLDRVMRCRTGRRVYAGEPITSATRTDVEADMLADLAWMTDGEAAQEIDARCAITGADSVDLTMAALVDDELLVVSASR